MINHSFFKYLSAINTSKSFSFLSDTKMHRDELVHSKYIADLLNPKGKHQYRDAFLKLFLEHFNHKLKLGGFLTSDAQVDLEYKKIDILIRSGDTAIIIENKIYAPDQEEQIYRYYEKILQAGYQSIKIIYLSPLGKEPESHSTEKLPEKVKQKDFILASYDIDIFSWISECKKLVPENNFLIQNNFNQYLNAIEKITGKHESLEYMSNIKELLLLDDNFEYIDTIIAARDELITDFQKELWLKIKTQLETLHFQKQAEPFYEKVDYNGKIKNSLFFNEFEIKLNSFENATLKIGFEKNNNKIFCSISCTADTFSTEYDDIYEKIQEAKKQVPDIKLNDKFYLKTSLGSNSSSTEKLSYLKNVDQQQKYVESSIAEISEIIELIKFEQQEKKGFFTKIFGLFGNSVAAKELPNNA